MGEMKKVKQLFDTLSDNLTGSIKKGYKLIVPEEVGKKIADSIQSLEQKRIEDQERSEKLCNDREKLIQEGETLLSLLDGAEKEEAELLRWKSCFEWADAIRREYEREVGIRHILVQILEMYEYPPESCWTSPAKLRAAIYNTYGKTALRQFGALPPAPQEVSSDSSWEEDQTTLRALLSHVERQTFYNGYSETELEHMQEEARKELEKIRAAYGSLTAARDRYGFMRENDAWVKRVEAFYGELKALLEGKAFCDLSTEISPAGERRSVEHFEEELLMDEGAIAYLGIVEAFCEGEGGLRAFLEAWPEDALDLKP